MDGWICSYRTNLKESAVNILQIVHGERSLGGIRVLPRRSHVMYL